MTFRITIIGTGLIGGSLGLALRRNNAAVEIIGHNRHHEAAMQAQRRGAIDRAEWNLPASVEKSDLVILATPVGQVRELLGQIAPYLQRGCVVTDVAGTKEKVLTWAEELLPEHISFVGGHPMAGKELSGIAAAEADLFLGCTYCIVPSQHAAPEAIDLVVTLAQAVGARPFFLDAAEHDSFVAAVSHLPFLAAAALQRTAASSSAWRDMRLLAATGFRDMTRLASGDPIMHRDLCRTNREAISHRIDDYIAELTRLRDLIASEDDGLEKTLRQAKEERDTWLQGREAEILPPLPGGGEKIRQLLFGKFGPGGGGRTTKDTK